MKQEHLDQNGRNADWSGDNKPTVWGKAWAKEIEKCSQKLFGHSSWTYVRNSDLDCDGGDGTDPNSNCFEYHHTLCPNKFYGGVAVYFFTEELPQPDEERNGKTQ
jgi:hypothetical protein|tara:strand:- start:420 stop:734 length:315 start_codon:yes stop_codon:yes gene_type:complete